MTQTRDQIFLENETRYASETFMTSPCPVSALKETIAAEWRTVPRTIFDGIWKSKKVSTALFESFFRIGSEPP